MFLSSCRASFFQVTRVMCQLCRNDGVPRDRNSGDSSIESHPQGEHSRIPCGAENCRRMSDSFFAELDAVVCHVFAERVVAAERTQHIVHVTAVWCHLIVQAITQVQVVESVKVHTVETVNLVPRWRESKQKNRTWMRSVGLRGWTLEVAAPPGHHRLFFVESPGDQHGPTGCLVLQEQMMPRE